MRSLNISEICPICILRQTPPLHPVDTPQSVRCDGERWCMSTHYGKSRFISIHAIEDGKGGRTRGCRKTARKQQSCIQIVPCLISVEKLSIMRLLMLDKSQNNISFKRVRLPFLYIRIKGKHILRINCQKAEHKAKFLRLTHAWELEHVRLWK